MHSVKGDQRAFQSLRCIHLSQLWIRRDSTLSIEGERDISDILCEALRPFILALINHGSPRSYLSARTFNPYQVFNNFQVTSNDLYVIKIRVVYARLLESDVTRQGWIAAPSCCQSP